MFPANDDEAAAASIMEILGSLELRQQLAADARLWAERFTVERSVSELVSLYQTCISRYGRQEEG
jgi:hypothetical protein